MKTYSLNGQWNMKGPDGVQVPGTIPGSVYSFLLDAGKMEDPFYRDNELKALKLMEQDYTFSKIFDVPREILSCGHQILRFDGIDTIADLYLNGTYLGHADNMHVAWEFDVKEALKEKENELSVCIFSPTNYIAEKEKEYHLGGSVEAMRGFPHLRKAHCMFGWDWGPRLPDQGVWKNVTLLGWNHSRLEDIRIHQEHFLADGTPVTAAAAGKASVNITETGEASGEDAASFRTIENADPADKMADHAMEAHHGQIRVALTVRVVQSADPGQSLPLQIELISPEGERYQLENGQPFWVPGPRLWWPNGLGDQPLYTLSVRLNDAEGPDGEVIEKRIGLRTASILRKPDQWGETFAACVNGRTFFSMGADYIPEDIILSRINKDRTDRLLTYCKESHFNVVRVWGGGYYPDDLFYDLCDEKGLLVWQDFMFACANYRLEDHFVESITEEIRQNVRRLRHHPSLGLWCGNNEMEQFALKREFDGDDKTAADYLIQNEYIIPRILKEEDPDTFYWPSSPSSGGKFVDPGDPDRGDVHYWEVWHGGLPFTAYRDFRFRYLSEFGFQSFPCLETVKAFTEPEDRNIFSYVMEMHQRNSGANGKIMQYLSLNYRYPGDFETLLYTSQVLQAEAIRYGVEHFRRNRNDDRCMGAVYWQLNDIWPVASWASVDYFYRWKALQYYAKRFFAPVMISCEEKTDVTWGRTCISEPADTPCLATLCVTNETWETVTDTVEWELRDPQSKVLRSGREEITVEPFHSLWLQQMDFSDLTYEERRTCHLSYRLRKAESSGSVLLVPPKHYYFADPQLSLQAEEDGATLRVEAKAYAKSVEIYAIDGCVRLSDNYFDMEAGVRTVKLLEGNFQKLAVRSIGRP